MVEKYLKLNEHQKTLFWLAIIGGVVFVGLCPLFFFYEAKGFSYPLGWLLGTAAEILSFYTIIKMSEALLPTEENPNPSAARVIIFVALRFLIYIVVLVIAAICTWMPSWFGGFDMFNFWTTFAGLLPVQAFLVISQLKAKRG